MQPLKLSCATLVAIRFNPTKKTMHALHCTHCATLYVKINGRSFRHALTLTRANSFMKAADVPVTQWIKVCPSCDAFALGADFTHPWPFLCQDDVMRTINDFEPDTLRYNQEIMEFAGFRFSPSALNSAIQLITLEDESTEQVELLGRQFLDSPSPEAAYALSQAVCEWGGGGRVWGNLNRHHTRQALSEQLQDWLMHVPSNSLSEVIHQGIQIKGLGVSFASKHLRMVEPQHFGVLDEVISLGLGFALNAAGYKLFMRMLEDFKRTYAQTESLAQLESGIFYLIRQVVRSSD